MDTQLEKNKADVWMVEKQHQEHLWKQKHNAFEVELRLMAVSKSFFFSEKSMVVDTQAMFKTV